uniref:Uncharacterized protein n=1 Tax=Oryza punctata TaxID=4537 RepID=A0A0E0MMG6_ORYPU
MMGEPVVDIVFISPRTCGRTSISLFWWQRRALPEPVRLRWSAKAATVLRNLLPPGSAFANKEEVRRWEQMKNSAKFLLMGSTHLVLTIYLINSETAVVHRTVQLAIAHANGSRVRT